MNNYQTRLNTTIQLLKEADYILIGAGAGLSEAAGIHYGGKRFTDNFSDFIKKFPITDMYSSSFYKYPTPNYYWAHWARKILTNYYNEPSAPLYQNIAKLANFKDYFVITTNGDGQFYKTNFDSNKIFEVQGNYGLFQCAKGCHKKLYNNEQIVRQMQAEMQDCQIPDNLIPKCPVCGGDMAVHLRVDQHFVQDEAWYKMQNNYLNFVNNVHEYNLVCLEFGIGFNTPSIIRYPFEELTDFYDNATLIRFNQDYPQTRIDLDDDKYIVFKEDINSTIADILTALNLN